MQPTESQPPSPPSRTRLVALIAVAIAIGWLALAAHPKPAELPRPPPSAAEASPSDALTPPPRSPHSRASAASAAPAVPAPAPTEPAPAPAEPEPEDEHQPIPPDTRGFFIDAIQTHYERDARDRDASAMETALRAFLRRHELPARALRSVICKTAICRLELYWRPEYDPTYRSSLDALANGNAKAIATRASPLDKHGGVDVDVYCVRSLIDLEPARSP